MLFARLYRTCLVTGEQLVAMKDIVVFSLSAHTMATIAAKREGAEFYELFKGKNFEFAKPVSFVHDVRGF